MSRNDNSSSHIGLSQPRIYRPPRESNIDWIPAPPMMDPREHQNYARSTFEPSGTPNAFSQGANVDWRPSSMTDPRDPREYQTNTNSDGNRRSSRPDDENRFIMVESTEIYVLPRPRLASDAPISPPRPTEYLETTTTPTQHSNTENVMYRSEYKTSSLGDDEEHSEFAFSNASIRRGFIRKVYSILLTQLLITVGVVAWFFFHEPTKLYVYENILVLFIAIGIMLFVIVVMMCFKRVYPVNLVLLFLFTLSMAFVLGATTSILDSDVVLLAIGATAVVCLSLTLFAFQTKWDITGMGPYLFVIVMLLSCFGVLSIFYYSQIGVLGIAFAGVAIFSLHLVYDTQLLVGGTHKYSISPEEYIFAALTLYLDIILIFLYILRIIGFSR